jgi:NADPH:quinone reductase-like Zn-dependent oxidoreductase
MRQWMIRSGAIDESSLDLIDNAPVPQPGRGEILIGVRAASLNYRDHLVLKGTYYGVLDHDIVPLSDAAGIVEAVGPGVARFKVGDRVVSQYYENWPDGPFIGEDKVGPPVGGPHQRGLLAEYAVLAEGGAMPIPDSMSFAGAAALPCAGATAWNALFGSSPVTAGQTVLVLGTGGVSMLALQLANMAGARVIATSSRTDKMARAKALGADVTINYLENPDWGQLVLDATDGKGCEKIIEIGGDGTLEQSLKSVAFGGEIALIGFMSHADAAPSAFNALYKAAILRGIAIGNARMFGEMTALFDRSGIEPVVDRVFAFEDTVAAYLYKRSADMFGKVVINVA